MFRSGVSILAVCEYCRTTLLNVDGKIENLGKMAELAQDRSCLQIGVQGVYRQKPFTIVGRIQLQYTQGLWNEWFLLFDDQRTGWLSEAAGMYSISFQHTLQTEVPPFSKLSPGNPLQLGNIEWTVTNIERATCVAGEGELPFKVGGGYPAPVIDLRSNIENKIITLDYSDDENHPLLFVGETVDFFSLKCRNLRENDPDFLPSGPKLRAKALNCKKCGATLEIKHEGTVCIACAHCGSISDADTGNLIEKINLANSKKVTPLIPIGSIGVFRGEKWEAIGFMQSYMVSEGQRYFWREYLLARVDAPGYRFLVEYDRHWSVANVLETAAGASNNELLPLKYRGKTFKHFQSYTGRIDYVIGEFTWLIKVKDTVRLVDYIAPPLMLTLERTDNEISWSLAEYVPSKEIAAAFNLKNLPEPSGVYANQPNPIKHKLQPAWTCFILLILLAFVVQIVLFSAKKIGQNNVEILVGSDAVLSSPFNLDETSSLELKTHVQKLNNEWLELGLALVRESDGEARYGNVEASYYSGWDSEDGSWVEDNLDRSLVFRNVPPGTWRILVDGIESSWFRYNNNPENTSSRMDAYMHNIPVSLEVKKYRAPWENFLLLLFALLIWPALLSLKSISFEKTRWAESDHSWQGEDD